MRHAEKCDAKTYCGRRIRSDNFSARDIPRFECSEVPTFDMCKRCCDGLLSGYAAKQAAIDAGEPAPNGLEEP